MIPCSSKDLKIVLKRIIYTGCKLFTCIHRHMVINLVIEFALDVFVVKIKATSRTWLWGKGAKMTDCKGLVKNQQLKT